MHKLATAATIALLFGVSACDSGGGGGSATAPSGTLTITAEQGIDFSTGQVVEGNFKADLYATSAGSHLKLATGGPNSTKNQPVNWFKQGGLPQTFGSLAEVPDDRPADGGLIESLTNTTAGVGFVAKNNSDGGYTKGWVKAADATSVTIEFEPLP